MSFLKSLRKALFEKKSLSKGEDPAAYAKLAQTGFILAHPVKIGGKDKRPDNNIAYHSTIKFFDKENDNAEHAHNAASKLEMHPPNPKEVGIEPKVLKDRNGNDVYAIGLHGKHADKLKEHHEKFGHMGHKENYKWGAHVSVDKDTHDKIKDAGYKTAHDAGIEFGHAELRRGPKTLHTYEPNKMVKTEDLEKGALKSMLTAGAMVGALASPAHTDSKAPLQGSLHPQVSAAPNSEYSRDKILNAISQVESSGGKNMKHKPTSMGTAFGAHAIMPDVIHDTLRLNPDLKKLHGKAFRLQGQNLSNYLQDNPELERQIVNRHLSRLESHFGHNPEAISYAWNQGIKGTNRAIKAKQNIADHPYVQKFKHAYERGK